MFSLATMGEDDVLGWHRFQGVALPELAALLFPDAPSPEVALVMLTQQHIKPILRGKVGSWRANCC